jgi:hypothetical protein
MRRLDSNTNRALRQTRFRAAWRDMGATSYPKDASEGRSCGFSCS